ncbi:PduM family microcompartment protein [Agarivorans sp. QJM3NY_33]|uniref:PduM family microcompartment protein n=1 Tax=Agarivorans sp. QJM3NY_33 TaxID=3421432 RepID=UPI003D7F0392
MSTQALNISYLVDAVLQQLQQREGSIYQVDLDILAKGLSASTYACHSHLALCLADLQFLQQLASAGKRQVTPAAVMTLLDAFAYGIKLNISVHQQLLPALPIQGLSVLPVALSDQHGATIHLDTRALISYQHVAQLNGKWLITPKLSLVTQLAKDYLVQRHIQLIKTE